MGSNWLPTKDANLLQFVVAFSAKITAAPTTYGLLAADATVLATATTLFSTTLATATNPSTRTKTSVAAKDVAKAQLLAIVRSDAKRIQANPAVTIPQKTDLGLPIRQAPSPIPAPAVAPNVSLESITLRAHAFRVADAQTPTKRGKPAGVQGAEVFSFVAAPNTPPPGDLAQWRFEGLTTDPDFNITYSESDAGKTATVVARWYNPRGETGPVSNPVSAPIAA